MYSTLLIDALCAAFLLTAPFWVFPLVGALAPYL